MSDANDQNGNEEKAGPYTSAGSLKEAHNKLIKRYNLHRQGGDGDAALWRDVEEFISRGRLTGKLLNEESDRWMAQSNLEFWAATIFREVYSKEKENASPPKSVLLDYDAASAPHLEDSACPYVGLDAFRESKYFFGRKRLRDTLLEKVRESRLVAIVGESGSGKSSLAMGGLIPALKEGEVPGSEGWHYFKPIVPGSTPLLALSRLLGDNGPTPDGLLDDPASFVRKVEETYETPTVLLVDQFEEAFTLCRESQTRHAFIESVYGLTHSTARRHTVILTMRSDRKYSVNELPESLDDFKEAFNHAQVPVTPLEQVELREVITRPAELANLKFERELVDALVQDMLGETAALPLLQFTLLKLWEKRSYNLVTMEAYKKLGRGRRALENSAEVLYGKLSTQRQITLKRILLRMVRPTEGLEFTSSRVTRASLLEKSDSPARVEEVLDALIKSRLVRQTETDSGDVQVEIAHEALVRNWPRLVNWLGEVRAHMVVRQRLEAKAAEWLRRERSSAELLDPVQLREAQEWMASTEATVLSYDPILDELVEESRKAIDQSELEKEKARRKELDQIQKLANEQKQRADAEKLRAEETERANRNLRFFLWTAVVGVLVLSGVAYYARRQGNRATTEAHSAKASKLAAQSLLYLAEQPDLSLLLGVQARNENPASPEAQNSLARVLEFNNALKAFLWGHDEPIVKLNFSANDELISADEKGNVIAWDVERRSRKRRSQLPPELSGAKFLAATPDGRLWAFNQDSKLKLWSPDAAAQYQQFDKSLNEVEASALSPDGKYLAVGGWDEGFNGSTEVWDTVTGKLKWRKPESSSKLTFSADGKTLAAVSDESVVMWDAATGRVRKKLRDSESNAASLQSITFSPDGKQLVAGSGDGTIRFWFLNKGPVSVTESNGSTKVSSNPINSVAFRGDGMRLAVGDAGGFIQVLSIEDDHFRGRINLGQ